jgi:hypothetical protein
MCLFIFSFISQAQNEYQNLLYTASSWNHVNNLEKNQLLNSMWLYEEYSWPRIQILFQLLPHLKRHPNNSSTIIQLQKWPSDGNLILQQLNDAGYSVQWLKPQDAGFIGLRILWK